MQSQQDIIRNQALSNLGISIKQANHLSENEKIRLESEMKRIVYAKSNLPNFIGDEKELKTDSIENDDYRRRWLNNIFYLNDIVNDMVSDQTQIPPNIIEEALSKIGFKISSQENLTDQHVQEFTNTIKKILAENHIVTKSESKETKLTSSNRKAARNFMRHILRGAIVKSDEEGKSYKDSLAMIEQCVDTKKSPELLIALREEMKIIFQNAANWIMNESLVLDEKDEQKTTSFNDNEKQFEIFIHGLMALYPFIDPKENEKVILPQKINNRWITVEYEFKRFDISPKTGLLSHLIEDTDRIYAYALVALEGQDPTIQSQLLLMGTTYPTGQGAELAVLENFRPRHSVGEGHDTSEIDAWIQAHSSKIKVSGQSKGAVMAMITAAKHPTKISEAHCLNPTALNSGTLERLQPKWNSLLPYEKPKINVYAQAGDPVFPLEKGFLSGTQIFRIYPNHNEISSFKPLLPTSIQRATEAHIHNFCGRSSALILRGNLDKYNTSRWRIFRSNLKEAVNVGLFPLLYVDLCGSIITRKVERKLGIAAPIIKPFTLMGKVTSMLLKGIVLIPTVLVGGLISGIKARCETVTLQESKHEATPVTVQNEITGSSAAKALAQRGVKLQQAQPLQSSNISIDTDYMDHKQDFITMPTEEFKESILRSHSRI